MRQLAGGLLPVAQALMVAAAGILVAKPAVVEQEHVHTQAHGIVHQAHQLLLVEVKEGGFPVVEQGHAVALAVFQAVLTCPAVQVAAGLATSLCAQREDEVGCDKSLAGLQLVGREVGIDARNQAQTVVLVHIEGEAVVACPCQGAHQHIACGLGRLTAQRELEERGHEHAGATAQLGVEHLLAKVQLALAHIHLVGPVAAELGEPVLATVERQQTRGIVVKCHSTLLAVDNLAVRYNDILVGIGIEDKPHRHGILVIAQGEHRLASAVAGRTCLV